VQLAQSLLAVDVRGWRPPLLKTAPPNATAIGVSPHRTVPYFRLSGRARLCVLLLRVCVCTGYGLKYHGARVQPLMRGPEADETKTMTVAWPHHACVPQHCQSGGSTIYYTAAPSSAFELCGCTRSALLATRRRHGVQVQELSRNSFADALFTQGLMALMQPIICCVRAQSAREFVTEFSGGATPHRSGVAQS